MSTSSPGESASKASGGRADGGVLGLLHALALIAVVVGAAASLGLLFRASERTPKFLLLLFIGWVLAPFVALVLADIGSKRWSVVTRTTLHVVMLIVTLGSFAMYGGVVAMPPGSRPAALFLMVPVGSLLLMAIVLPIAAVLSGRRSRERAGA
jgi:hypothetical protein